MSSLSGLPAFFQSKTKTVLDELADFELGGGLEDDGMDEMEPSSTDMDAFEDMTGTFGDLNADNLPDFFKNPTKAEQENYDIFDSMANQTLDDEPNMDSLYLGLPAGARISNTYPVTGPVTSQALPPGLSASKPAAPVAPPAAIDYKQLLGQLSTPAAVPVPPAVPTESRPAPPAAPFSYARAAGAVSAPPATETTNQAPLSASASMGPPAMQHPPYILNPELPTAGILRGTSVTSNQSTATSTASTTHHSSTGFSAQRPLLYNNASGFSVPVGASANAAQQHRKEMPRGKFMAPSDVRYVVNKVLQPMETTDPFADDFYFLQLSIKKNAKAREAALRSASELPEPIYVPLPVWKETKERIRLQMDATRRTFHAKSREWEQREQVLGHHVRSDIHRPREQLAMPSLSEIDFDMDDEEIGGELRNPFSSRLWTMRVAVQRGYEALYTVQELQHLLSSPLIAANPAAHGEICREIDSAVSLLSQSLGIRSTAPSSTAGTVSSVESDIALDGAHVAAILQTAIGRKLMTRSLKLLSPPHRWALLPVILAKILLSPPAQDPPSSSSAATSSTSTTGSTSTPVGGVHNEALVVEQRLLRTIIEFLQYSFQFQIEQQSQAPPGVSAVFTNVLLSNLRQCIKSVIVTQMEKSKLRQALISERTRAEVMHIVVQIGDKVRPSADARLAEEWSQTREAFMSMLDN